jgi:hypothetical protein
MREVASQNTQLCVLLISWVFFLTAAQWQPCSLFSLGHIRRRCGLAFGRAKAAHFQYAPPDTAFGRVALRSVMCVCQGALGSAPTRREGYYGERATYISAGSAPCEWRCCLAEEKSHGFLGVLVPDSTTNPKTESALQCPIQHEMEVPV